MKAIRRGHGRSSLKGEVESFREDFAGIGRPCAVGENDFKLDSSHIMGDLQISCHE